MKNICATLIFMLFFSILTKIFGQNIYKNDALNFQLKFPFPITLQPKTAGNITKFHFEKPDSSFLLTINHYKTSSPGVLEYYLDHALLDLHAHAEETPIEQDINGYHALLVDFTTGNDDDQHVSGTLLAATINAQSFLTIAIYAKPEKFGSQSEKFDEILHTLAPVQAAISAVKDPKKDEEEIEESIKEDQDDIQKDDNSDSDDEVGEDKAGTNNQNPDEDSAPDEDEDDELKAEDDKD